MRHQNVDEKIPLTSVSILCHRIITRYEIRTPHTSADILFLRCFFQQHSTRTEKIPWPSHKSLLLMGYFVQGVVRDKMYLKCKDWGHSIFSSTRIMSSLSTVVKHAYFKDWIRSAILPRHSFMWIIPKSSVQWSLLIAVVCIKFWGEAVLHSARQTSYCDIQTYGSQGTVSL